MKLYTITSETSKYVGRFDIWSENSDSQKLEAEMVTPELKELLLASLPELFQTGEEPTAA